MSWEQVLKISRKEATELGDKYAPEDMKQFRLEQSKKQKEDAKPALKQYLNELDSDKSIDEMRFKMIRQAIILLSNNYRFRGKSREQLIDELKEYSHTMLPDSSITALRKTKKFIYYNFSNKFILQF